MNYAYECNWKKKPEDFDEISFHLFFFSGSFFREIDFGGKSWKMCCMQNNISIGLHDFVSVMNISFGSFQCSAWW